MARIVVAYCVMCAIWGTTWLGIKISLQYVPPMSGAGIRFLIAGLAFYLLALANRKIPTLREVPWKLVLVMAAFLFGLNYILTYVSETRLASGLVSVLFGTLPFFMFGFGSYLLHERTTSRTWIGAILGFFGVAVISLAGGVSGAPLCGLAVLGAAASSAFANVYAKRHSHHDPLVSLPPAMLIAGLVVFLIGMFAEHPDLSRALQPGSIGAIAYLAIVGSCLAFFLNLWLLQRIDASVVGLSALIIPVIAVLVGIFFGGESFGWRDFAGAALVILGMWIALRPQTPAYHS